MVCDRDIRPCSKARVALGMSTMKFLVPFLLAAVMIVPACAETPNQSGSSAEGAHPEDAPTVVPLRLITRCAHRSYGLVAEGDAVRVQRDDGLVLARPDGMDLYVPVGLGCARTSAGGEHLVVQYGESLLGCKVCEWLFIYDEAGRPMHNSVPAFNGEGSTLAPNNDGYGRVAETLGLQKPVIEYDSTRRVPVR